MATGSFTYNPNSDASPVLASDAHTVLVYRYNKDEPNPDKCFKIIPNIQCDAITTLEGLTPQTAKFSYILDDRATANNWPTQYEQIFGLIDALSKGQSPKSRDAVRRKNYVVVPDDRLCVIAWNNPKDKTDYEILFDGFAESPEVGVSGRSQKVYFEASGVAVRLWDYPLYYRVERDASTPKTFGSGSWHMVDGPVIFNPRGKPNCTLAGYEETVNDAEGSGNTYSIFIDPLVGKLRTPADSSKWTLYGFAGYLMGHFNDETYVDNPDFGVMEKLLKSRKPKGGSDYFDPNDSSTYDESDIELVEYDVTGKYWPDALGAQLSYNGFGAKFVLEADKDGRPSNKIEIYRKDGVGIGTPLDVYHQDAYEALDPVKTTTSEFSITRDYKRTYNAVVVDTKPTRWEVSVILAPLFQPATGDESADNKKQFDKSNWTKTTIGEIRDKYRVWGVDEAADGHWDTATKTMVTSSFDWSAIWPDDEDTHDRTYAKRYRPGVGTLISVDSLRKPLKAVLEFSRDYLGPPAVLWGDKGIVDEGHWQPIVGGWGLLPDRLGIRVNCKDPSSWAYGGGNNANAQESSKKLDAITSMAKPATPNTYFYLRLTTVIESDTLPVGITPRRKTSALGYERAIYAHAKQQFYKKTVAPHSLFNAAGVEYIVQDDTDKITSYAVNMQEAHENPMIAGRFVIPHIDTGFPIGEVIRSVKGRDLSLQINAGTEQGAGKRYPTIVGVTYEFTGRQATIIQVSDHRADPR
ncbi:MAG: hypothetical protein KGL39_27400 [Patescibacteria group bacterium]|nr:hypothetical protein [Patescibacteria group bacterium]